MAEPARCWLLVLGSNAADAGARLDAALAMLGGLGEIERVSPQVDGDDIAARGPRYLNQLVMLRAALEASALREASKRIEQAQGRHPQRLQAGICDLDIDVLASIDGDGAAHWLADKPLGIPAVRATLDAWGIGWSGGCTCAVTKT
jgi:2-amino-4-hydroxy-6-hydroxymethyldihydropteridine diphosphokinase